MCWRLRCQLSTFPFRRQRYYVTSEHSKLTKRRYWLYLLPLMLLSALPPIGVIVISWSWLSLPRRTLD